MKQDISSTKQISLATSVMIFVIVCLLSNSVSMLYQRGAFHFWKSLPSLSSPIIQIVNADPDNIWVISEDKNIYVAAVHCISNTPCRKWILVRDSSEIYPSFEEYTVRKNNCEEFEGSFPKNPLGKVSECIKTSLPPAEGGGYDIYFALMSNGKIKYWERDNGFFFSPIINTFVFNLLFATLVCPTIVVVTTSAVYARVHKRAG